MASLWENRGNWWAIAAAVTALTVMTAAVTSLAILYSFGMSRTEENSPSNRPSDRRDARPTAGTDPMVEAVAASGYIEPEGEVISISAPAFVEGARVEQLLVKRGDKV